ncbi:helix-turn-helix domain-containing protein [Nitrincola sp. MINF-07-Sa-05]|uniref:helix-turn-helix domain-containing protein n=1 Tax=Nitrincola salilacus TaxID=3400273 RepID=UPI00391800D0
MEQISEQLGQNLRLLRQEKQWSLDEAARRTGVSKAMLGQIERGESSPTIATLWRIATGFHISYSSLLTGLTTQAQGALTEPCVTLLSDDPGIRVMALFPYNPATGFEVMQLQLEPGSITLSDPHEVGVTEHLIVTEGCIELWLEGEWRRLEKGAAFRFSADQPHGYRNNSSLSAEFHDIIHYAGQIRPAQSSTDT